MTKIYQCFAVYNRKLRTLAPQISIETSLLAHCVISAQHHFKVFIPWHVQDRRDARSATAGTTNATAKDNEQATHEIDSMIREFSTRLTHTGPATNSFSPVCFFWMVTKSLKWRFKELWNLSNEFAMSVKVSMFETDKEQGRVSDV